MTYIPEPIQALLDTGMSLAQIKAAGIKWDAPSTPSELTAIRDMLSDSLAGSMAELDQAEQDRIVEAVPAFKVMLLVDMKDGEPMVTDSAIKKVIGSAGRNQAFLDTRTGTLHDSRVSALWAEGMRVQNDVLRKQMAEYLPEVVKVNLSDNGVPITYAERVDENIGDGTPISESLLDQLGF